MGRIVQARLDDETLQMLTKLRRQTRLTDSEILRRGVRRLAQSSAATRRRIVGLGRFVLPARDLATNKKHLKDFGRS